MDISDPAFPSPEIRGQDGCGIREGCYGMSLRDYFAAKAMQSMVSRGGDHGAFAAESAYRFADCMLAERQKDAP